MKISLRKANAAQLALAEAIKALKLDTDIVLNEFSPAEQQIAVAQDKFNTALSLRNELILALFTLRGQISEANAASGISAKLNNFALVEKDLTLLSALSKRKVRESEAVLEGQLKKLAAADAGNYYSHRQVETSILTEDGLNNFSQLALLAKRRKQVLQDELLELNVKTQIELDDAVAEFLQSQGLV